MKYFIFITILTLASNLFLVFSANALTISPVRVEISGDPGQTLHGEIELFNEEAETRTFFSSTANFEARGEGGAPHFLPERTGFATWISVQEKITLKPQERINVPYSITTPPEAEPGGHFAAIFWGTSPPHPDEAGQVAIGGKLGMLILLNVTGEVEEGGGILDFKIEQEKIVTSLPVIFTYRFSNDGDARIRPVGEIKIRNILGFTSAIIDANKAEGNVLPGSVRKFRALWHSAGQRMGDLTKMEELALMTKVAEEVEKEKGFFEIAGAQWRNFAFGLYTAELNLAFGNGGEKTWHRFFVFPWQLLIIIIVMLTIFGFFAVVGIKKYNRWIIKQAQAGKFQ